MSKFVNQMVLDNGIRPPKTGDVSYRVWNCPGLYLRVSATGAASWRAMYRVDGKQVKEVLGPLAKIPRVDEAVRRARASFDEARAGVNPVAARRHAAELANANTVAAAVERWLTACETGVTNKKSKKLRPRTVSGYRQIMKSDVLPRWGARPLAEITKTDVEALLYEKATTRLRARKGATGGARVQANRVGTRLGTFFGWCVRQGLLTEDPTATVEAAEEESRDRVLSRNEIRRLWQATEPVAEIRRNGVAWGSLFRVLLLTAARRSEVAGMAWSEIDGGIWQIPGARTKNGKPHTVHLSHLAIAELDRLPRGGRYVFSATNQTPASGFTRAKARLDAAMQTTEPWVVHDIRRSATTHMVEDLKVAPHVVDKILNHAAGVVRGVARVYNRAALLDERKAALEAWSRFVADLVGLGEGNVVALRKMTAVQGLRHAFLRVK